MRTKEKGKYSIEMKEFPENSLEICGTWTPFPFVSLFSLFILVPK